MPIDYKKYPPNWKTEIVPRILSRASHKCEICGLDNKSIIVRYRVKPWIYYTGAFGEYLLEKSPLKHKRVKVVLTVHHIDHDPENWGVEDSKLIALCQRCHHIFNKFIPVKKG